MNTVRGRLRYDEALTRSDATSSGEKYDTRRSTALRAAHAKAAVMRSQPKGACPARRAVLSAMNTPTDIIIISENTIVTSTQSVNFGSSLPAVSLPVGGLKRGSDSKLLIIRNK